GGNIGQGIMKALRMSLFDVKIVGTDMNPLSAGLLRCDKAYVVKGSDHKGFLNEIVKIIRKEKVKIVLVGSDFELDFFSHHKNDIENQTGCYVLTSSLEVCQASYDKWKTYLFCRERNIPYPETCLPHQKVLIRKMIRRKGFPVILKPRVGYGSRFVEKINDRKELDFFLNRIPDPIVQEYLGSDSKEYTAASFVDSVGRIVGTILFKRMLSAGATYKAEVVQDSNLVSQVQNIVRKIKPLGPCNIQFREVSGNVVPFEFNIRFSGTTPIRAALGFNDVEMALRHFVFREKLKGPKIKKGLAFRYWNEVIVEDVDFQILRKRKRGHLSGKTYLLSAM
ncbi:MAG: ATP-grasp domain-containing protein, partial [Candidatus Omnitrophica bacterium]|nr:ATP-grasp domain-containing protein [Candidatus Omnitrophota bacterium]